MKKRNAGSCPHYTSWREREMKKILNAFGNLKIAGKLSVGFFAIVVVFLIVTGFSMLGLFSSFNALKNISDSVIPLNQKTFKLQVEILQNKMAMLTALAASDQFSKERFLTEVSEQKLAPIFNEISQLMIKDKAQRKKGKTQLEMLKEVETLYKQIQEVNLDQAIPLIREGKQEEAAAIIVIQQEERYQEVFAKLNDLLDKRIKDTGTLTKGIIKSSNKTMKTATVVIIIAIVAAVFIILSLTKAITKPLNIVMESSAEIADGNLNIQEIAINQEDEFGHLGKVFNRMIKQLRYLTKVSEEIAEGDLSTDVAIRSEKDVLANAFARMSANLKALAVIANQIAEGDLSADVTVRSRKDMLATAFSKMSMNLKTLVKQINQASNVVTQSSQILAQATEQAAQAASQLTGVVGQITQATNDVAKTSQVAATSSQSANSSARAGQETASKLLEKMRSIQGAVSKAQESIESLGKQSQKIGDIVNVITKIAEQTNLLSLNAAIEAARAGESGRGFAVVADEIRKLAEHSATSALEISKLIAEVQAETRRAVISTEQGTKEVKEGGIMMMEADKAFATINTSVESVSTQIEQIAATSEETAAATEEMAATSEEQAAAIDEVFTNAQNLAKTAEDLKQLVATFKLN